jgi:hypothetical protein
MAASGMLDLGAIAEMAATLPAIVNSLLKEVQAIKIMEEATNGRGA